MSYQDYGRELTLQVAQIIDFKDYSNMLTDAMNNPIPTGQHMKLHFKADAARLGLSI